MSKRTKEARVIQNHDHHAGHDAASAGAWNATRDTIAATATAYPLITSISLIRVTDGNVGGFTTVVLTTQGDKVLKTQILDKIWPRPSAEDDFKVSVAYEVFQKAPDTLIEIEFKDGKYQWKS